MCTRIVLSFSPFRRQQSAYQEFGRYSFYHSSRIETPLLLAHANVLAMKRKAHYPLTHTQIKTFTASSAARHVSIDNTFLGPIPERILIAFVKNTAFVGSVSTNPFHFHHYDMLNLVLFVNGVKNPSEPLIVLQHLVLPGLTKHIFRVLVSITTTVLIWLHWKCSQRVSTC